jgi:hypothetical protein
MLSPDRRIPELPVDKAEKMAKILCRHFAAIRPPVPTRTNKEPCYVP